MTEEEYIDVLTGPLELFTADGFFVEEADVRVAGEVWRVHKYDADPFPSRPHAHCIGGAKRFAGLKLHLGTRQLFDRATPLDRFLGTDQFDQLIQKIRPKFPDLELPIATGESVARVRVHRTSNRD